MQGYLTDIYTESCFTELVHLFPESNLPAITTSEDPLEFGYRVDSWKQQDENLTQEA